MKNLIGAIQWKTKQKYSELKCYLGGGYYIWEMEDGVNFVSRSGDAFSHVLYVCKGHEKIEMRWCSQWIEAGKQSQSIIDCGANIGYFSAVLAQVCSLNKILAIEGNKHTTELCRQNLDILDIKNVTVVEAVLAANSSHKYVIPDIPGREPWQQAIKVDSSSSITCTLTLDEIVAQYMISPSLVKIDCEGFETFILRGANDLLNSIRPAFMIECNDNALKAAGTNRHELFELLHNFNYKLFHLASFTDAYPFGIDCNESFPASEFNFAAIPNDEHNLHRWYHSIQFFNY